MVAHNNSVNKRGRTAYQAQFRLRPRRFKCYLCPEAYLARFAAIVTLPRRPCFHRGRKLFQRRSKRNAREVASLSDQTGRRSRVEYEQRTPVAGSGFNASRVERRDVRRMGPISALQAVTAIENLNRIPCGPGRPEPRIMRRPLPHLARECGRWPMLLSPRQMGGLSNMPNNSGAGDEMKVPRAVDIL
jgi:hypothetical protein